MIHVITAHYKSEKWIDVQLSYLKRNMGEPYETWASLEGVEHRAGDFDHVIASIGKHAAKLNLMAAEVCHSQPADDLLMFLDGDAFPIDDPMPLVREALGRSDLVGVRQSENLNEPQPHPCFTVTSCRTWTEIHGDWTGACPWVGPKGDLITDVGGNLLRLLEMHGKSWTPILRTNKVDLDPLWYGIYGDVVYHHGAGFRRRYSWRDVEEFDPPKWLPGLERHPLVGAPVRYVNYARRSRIATRVSQRAVAVGDELYAEIQSDPLFYKRFG